MKDRRDHSTQDKTNVNIDFKETGWFERVWTEMAQDRVQ
jgi:hypothetical protein